MSKYLGLGESEPLAKNIPISIVDDDESVREAMAGLMKSHGYYGWLGPIMLATSTREVM